MMMFSHVNVTELAISEPCSPQILHSRGRLDHYRCSNNTCEYHKEQVLTATDIQFQALVDKEIPAETTAAEGRLQKKKRASLSQVVRLSPI